ncbi:MAG: ComEA family DNA-binding protein [Candidatus Omnitrophota bacterium]|nr:ComEA family DNA-binding protein [Candidatus Omnitrophota bacterium]
MQNVLTRSRWFQAFLVLTLLLGGTSLLPTPWAYGAPVNTSQNAGQISVNEANFEELQAIQGVGPAVARRIIEYREANGPFRLLGDLTLVRGIGTVKFLQIKPQIRL